MEKLRFDGNAISNLVEHFNNGHANDIEKLAKEWNSFRKSHEYSAYDIANILAKKPSP